MVPESGGGMLARTLLELPWLVSRLRVTVLRVHGAPLSASVDCVLFLLALEPVCYLIIAFLMSGHSYSCIQRHLQPA